MIYKLLSKKLLILFNIYFNKYYYYNTVSISSYIIYNKRFILPYFYLIFIKDIFIISFYFNFFNYIIKIG